jgi:hypothetical protein
VGLRNHKTHNEQQRDDHASNAKQSGNHDVYWLDSLIGKLRIAPTDTNKRAQYGEDGGAEPP